MLEWNKSINTPFKSIWLCVHAHVPDAQTKKLDGKSVQRVNLGVSEESKAYKLYEPIQGKVIIKMDVIFEEEEIQNWNIKGQASLEDSHVKVEECEAEQQERIELTTPRAT